MTMPEPAGEDREDEGVPAELDETEPALTHLNLVVDVTVEGDEDPIKILRHGFVPADLVTQVRLSADGIDWSDAT